ncbi:NAD(P)-dependent oxidoreductase [Mobilicoccus sp.]|uniref:NAD(P)-dependent oxidoreductase n=1 Tax=Mobilicoccus sp. TaxID=2034349 RepID=UPI0028B2337E|nr:NAD(P)-dependent oxidoreductase [Mobilicoccus sp.]
MSAAPFLLGLSLAGRRVVAVGGGPVTARRVADLSAAGAHVHLIAPTITPEIAALVVSSGPAVETSTTASTEPSGSPAVRSVSGEAQADPATGRPWLKAVGDATGHATGAGTTGHATSVGTTGRETHGPGAERGGVGHAAPGDGATATMPGRVSWEPRAYAGEADLEGAWLVHVATGDPGVDARVTADAERSRVFCVAAGEAGLGTARVPARAVVDTESGPISLAVHAADDPRRAVAVRGAAQDHLAVCAATHLTSGAVDLRARRRPVPGRVTAREARPLRSSPPSKEAVA